MGVKHSLDRMAAFFKSKPQKKVTAETLQADLKNIQAESSSRSSSLNPLLGQIKHHFEDKRVPDPAWQAVLRLAKTAQQQSALDQVQLLQTLGELAIDHEDALLALIFVLHQFFQAAPVKTQWYVLYTAMYTLYEVIATTENDTIRNLAFENTLFGFTSFAYAYCMPGQDDSTLKFAAAMPQWPSIISIVGEKASNALSQKTIYYLHAITMREISQLIFQNKAHSNSREVIYFPAKTATPKEVTRQQQSEHAPGFFQYRLFFADASDEKKDPKASLEDWLEKLRASSDEQKITHGDKLWEQLQEDSLKKYWHVLLDNSNGAFPDFLTKSLRLKKIANKNKPLAHKDYDDSLEALKTLHHSLQKCKQHARLINDAIEHGLIIANHFAEQAYAESKYKSALLPQQAIYEFYQFIEALILLLPEDKQSALYLKMGYGCQQHGEYNLACHYSLRAYRIAEAARQHEQAALAQKTLENLQQTHQDHNITARRPAVELARIKFAAESLSEKDNLADQKYAEPPPIPLAPFASPLYSDQVNSTLMKCQTDLGLAGLECIVFDYQEQLGILTSKPLTRVNLVMLAHELRRHLQYACNRDINVELKWCGTPSSVAHATIDLPVNDFSVYTPEDKPANLWEAYEQAHAQAINQQLHWQRFRSWCRQNPRTTIALGILLGVIIGTLACYFLAPAIIGALALSVTTWAIVVTTATGAILSSAISGLIVWQVNHYYNQAPPDPKIADPLAELGLFSSDPQNDQKKCSDRAIEPSQNCSNSS